MVVEALGVGRVQGDGIVRIWELFFGGVCNDDWLHSDSTLRVRTCDGSELMVPTRRMDGVQIVPSGQQGSLLEVQSIEGMF